MNEYIAIWQITAPFWRFLSQFQQKTILFSSTAELRVQLLQLFERFIEDCQCLTISLEAQRDIQYAIVALIDEQLLNSESIDRAVWLENTLQWHFFQENCAGVVFFEKLTHLLIKPDKNYPVLMVYYLCLQMGFQGRYAFETPEQLSILQEKVSHYLQIQGKANQPVVERKLNHPHVTTKKMGWLSVKRGLWLVVGMIGCFYIGLQWRLSHILSDSLGDLTKYQTMVQAQIFHFDILNLGIEKEKS